MTFCALPAIDADHPELDGTIAGMFDAVKSGKAAPEPPGTEIVGILVARAKLTGVAPEAKLLSVAISGGKAKPAQSTSLQLLKGINWAFDAGARIMNMSFAVRWIRCSSPLSRLRRRRG